MSINTENLQINQVMSQEVGNYLFEGNQISVYENRFITENGFLQSNFTIYVDDEKDISNRFKVHRKIAGDYSLEDTHSVKFKLIHPVKSLIYGYNNPNLTKFDNDEMTEHSSNQSYLNSVTDSSQKSITDSTVVQSYSDKAKENNFINKLKPIINKNTNTKFTNTKLLNEKKISLDEKEMYLFNKRKDKKSIFVDTVIQSIMDYPYLDKIKNGEIDKLYINTINSKFLKGLIEGDWIFLKHEPTIEEINKIVKEYDSELKISTKNSVPKGKDAKIFKELYVHNIYTII